MTSFTVVSARSSGLLHEHALRFLLAEQRVFPLHPWNPIIFCESAFFPLGIVIGILPLYSATFRRNL